ncbi:response regulator [Chitinophaga lutea]
MKKRILIIDDSAPIRMLLEAFFSRQYAVVSAPDGLAAMSWLSKGNTADMIITDLQMPHISGEELLAFLSSSYLYQDVPVMVISGSFENELDELKVRYPNVQSVASKPFDPVALMKTVNEVLSRPVTAIAG